MSPAARIFPGLRGRPVRARRSNGVEFGAVPVLSIALAATNFVPLLANNSKPSKPEPKGKKTMNAAPCGCRPSPGAMPWCPFRAARIEGRRAAETYGAALRGEPKAQARVSRIAQATAQRDPRAARAAQKLDDAGKARRIASQAHKGDRKAQQAVDSMREQRDLNAEAAEACSMVEFFLDLPPHELDSFELMTHQFDTDPDAWLFEEFTSPQLATGLIESENYNWPV